MRKICHARPLHNAFGPRRAGPALLAPLLIALLAAGCGREDRRAPAARGDAPRPDARDAARSTVAAVTAPDSCPLVVDRASLAAFREVARRLEKGHDVPAARFHQLAATPGYASLFASTDPALFSPTILENVTRHVYGGATGARSAAGPAAKRRAAAREATGPKRQDVIDALTWSRTRGAAIDSLLDRFQAAPDACALRSRVAGYLRPDALADTLAVSFVLGGPYMTCSRERVVVDAGLALAAGQAQLSRLIAGHAYRTLARAPGQVAPEHAAGGEALRATFAKLAREGISAWLEGYPTVEFDRSHPQLGQPDAKRRDWVAIARRTLEYIDPMLAALVADERALARQGGAADDVMRVNGAYAPTGCAMAALIATRLGEERLRDAARGRPLDFVNAYQDAARAEGGAAPPDCPWVDPQALAALPPFSDQTLTGLRELLVLPSR